MSASEITTRIPGTFYRQESPDSPPFVSEGDQIEVGAVVGLVEVMKMFKQVTSDVAGTVTEICVENEAEVSAGEVLMRVEVG